MKVVHEGCALDGQVKTLMCSTCKKKKPVSDFTISNGKTRGYSSYCKQCMRERRQTPEFQRGIWRRVLNYYHGITPEDYDEMLDAQNGVCAICGKQETAVNNTGKTVKRLAVDHDHDTGAIRGLLCTRCNTAIGCLLEDEEIILGALSYIRERCK